VDISDDKEYVVCKYYDELPQVLLKIYPAEMAKVFEQRIRREWEKKVTHGMSSFVFTRKIDLSASGTRLLSLFSEEPRFLSADSWGIRNLSSEDSRILTLWFNSTLFLAEILSKRTQTRGSWGRIDEHYVFEMSCIDPSKIDSRERQTLLDLFKDVSNARFPSLIEQLRSEFEPRKKIDLAFLKILGFDEEANRKLLKGLYEATYDRIRSMKETMMGD
jgi:hypothetical protein